MENWKIIIGFEDYKISDAGRVKNCNYKKPGNERFLNPTDNGKGYLKVKLYSFANKKMFFVHQLVALHFITIIEAKTEVNHIDGNKHNNKVDNLEWVNNSENIRHAWDNGLNKFSDEQVRLQREKVCKPVIDLNTGVFYVSVSDLVNVIGISRTKINLMLHNKKENNTSYRFA